MKKIAIILAGASLVFLAASCGTNQGDIMTQDGDASEQMEERHEEPIQNDAEKDKELVVDESQEDSEERPEPQVRRFDMVAKQWEFEPAVIEVYEGDTVQINVTSTDVAHGFAVNEYEIDVRVEPGETANIAFVADKKGTFTFYCSVFCGSGHGKMKGSLMVK